MFFTQLSHYGNPSLPYCLFHSIESRNDSKEAFTNWARFIKWVSLKNRVLRPIGPGVNGINAVLQPVILTFTEW